MAHRKSSGGLSQGTPAFIVAPKALGNLPARKDVDAASNCKLQVAKSIKTVHRRLTSDFPSSKPKARNPFAYKPKVRKSHARSNSPVAHFKDLSEMFDLLTRQLTKGSAKWSPYSNSPGLCSPRLSNSPKERASVKGKSPKLHSPRPSVPAHVELKQESGVLVTPRLYEHQIFRDVFDERGNPDRVLYSSSEESSLDVYHTVGSQGGKITLIPKDSSLKCESKAGMCVWEERRQSYKESTSPALGDELIQKLRLLQDRGDRSQSDTACEEVRDSRKQRDGSSDS